MTTADKHTCMNCFATFKWSGLSNCPSCGESFTREEESLPSSSFKTDGHSKLSFETRKLVEAQDRTTFAVRSLALFFFISLQTALFGGGMIGLALNNRAHYDAYGDLNQGATFFVILGWLIAFMGFLVAVLVGRFELNKSKVNR